MSSTSTVYGERFHSSRAGRSAPKHALLSASAATPVSVGFSFVARCLRFVREYLQVQPSLPSLRFPCSRHGHLSCHCHPAKWPNRHPWRACYCSKWICASALWWTDAVWQTSDGCLDRTRWHTSKSAPTHSRWVACDPRYFAPNNNRWSDAIDWKWPFAPHRCS